MSLIKCVECGKKFSDKAEACPKCSCPITEIQKNDYCLSVQNYVQKEEIKEKAFHILQCQLKDNTKAHILTPGGVYVKCNRRGQEPFCAQDCFCQEAKELVKNDVKIKEDRVFIPAQHHE